MFTLARQICDLLTAFHRSNFDIRTIEANTASQPRPRGNSPLSDFLHHEIGGQSYEIPSQSGQGTRQLPNVPRLDDGEQPFALEIASCRPQDYASSPPVRYREEKIRN